MKDVIIVHDLIPFYYAKHFPGVLNRVQNAYVMLRMKSSIKTADKVITISEYSKQDILKIVPKAEKRHMLYSTAMKLITWRLRSFQMFRKSISTE